ncbi:piggyBac transposable element-derived protein 4-like [Amphiura filiformis]|uniref:piggyBac transposable element-derived protein 4-like n=1 Tax=Amphiura filiformis TaxID=82378 RepID=UPI003B21F435
MELAKSLLQKRTYLTGVIKMNGKDLPTSLSPNPNKNPRSKVIKAMNRTRRGTFYSRQKGDCTYVLWKDSKIMSLLSTGHNAYRNKDEDRVQRSFSIDGVEKRDKHMIPAPKQAVDYNKFMGGVDLSDQL